jgi:hypothetical protein
VRPNQDSTVRCAGNQRFPSPASILGAASNAPPRLALTFSATTTVSVGVRDIAYRTRLVNFNVRGKALLSGGPGSKHESLLTTKLQSTPDVGSVRGQKLLAAIVHRRSFVSGTAPTSVHRHRRRKLCYRVVENPAYVHGGRPLNGISIRPSPTFTQTHLCVPWRCETLLSRNSLATPVASRLPLLLISALPSGSMR